MMCSGGKWSIRNYACVHQCGSTRSQNISADHGYISCSRTSRSYSTKQTGMWCPFDHTRLLLLLQAEGEEMDFVSVSKSKGNAQTIPCFHCRASQSLLISLSHFLDHNDSLLFVAILHDAVSDFILPLRMTPICHFSVCWPPKCPPVRQENYRLNQKIIFLLT